MQLGDDTLAGIRVWALVTGAVILALVATADALLRWWVRRKIRRDEAAAASSSPDRRQWLVWFDRGLHEALPPLTLLMWVLGVAAAATVLVTDSEWTGAARVRQVAVWLRDAGTMAALFWLLLRIGRVIEAGITSLAPATANAWDDALLPVAGKAARVLLPIVALILGVQALSIPDDYQSMIRTALSLVLIGVTAFLLYQCITAIESLVLQRYRMDVKDNLEARAVYTQVTVLKKIATAVLVIVTVASMLTVFESVRQFGTSILASAGIAGIIVGFAAQRSIATLLAGLQIAVTQPIRLDDVVIVENEWGRIEEITLTYVCVRIWDQRRLILPITYFIEHPFQNWTRQSAEILGTVFLYVDYRTPLDVVRTELTRILEGSASWDGRVNSLQVTEAKAQTIEIRALASAADASLAWDLRCEVREKLIDFLQRNHPESLPRVRAEVDSHIAGFERR